jgi:hypothetical protein
MDDKQRKILLEISENKDFPDHLAKQVLARAILDLDKRLGNDSEIVTGRKDNVHG